MMATTSMILPLKGCDSGFVKCPSGAEIWYYCRRGSGKSVWATGLPVLVLLHGYPQNCLMWREFENDIPEEWTVLAPDLPGYGNSTKPINVDADGQSSSHSKKEWAKDIVHLVDTLFSSATRFIAYGHDRGARLAYSLALHYPSRVAGLACLDIVPTSYMWDAMRLEKDHIETKRSHHWVFLSSPRPLPETMIASNPTFYFDFTMRSWIGPQMRDTELGWITESIQPYLDSERGKDRIAAACEDYRAGATHDVLDDNAFSINPLSVASPAPSSTPPFTCPMLILSSHHLRRRFDVDGIWFSLGAAGRVQSYQIGDDNTGHFIVNEAHAETVQRTCEWLGAFWPGSQM